MDSYGDAPPLPGPTPIVIRVVQDPPAAPAPMVDAPLPPPPDAPEKNDEFYKYWDRFLNEKPSGKNSKKALREAQNAGIVSLDADPEGRPSHLTRRNTQGIVNT